MKRMHAFTIALFLAVAAGAGLMAATQTAGLRTGSGPKASAAPGASSRRSTIAARARKLNRIEAALRKALRDRPPALPAIPAARTPAAPAAAPQQRVIYQRPAPIVVVKHRAGGEQEHESEDGGGGDD
jgi:hypothetical protein